MKIEIKKIKIAEHMSEETTAFTAEIYVNGVNAGYAKNDGHGGCTYYHCYDGKKELIRKAEEHCLTLPPIKYPASLSYEAFEMDSNLENFIDKCISDEEKKKDQKKLEKKMTNHIMWGVPGGHSYTQVKFKVPLAQIPAIQLQVYVNKYKKEFKEGVEFLNTNLEALGVKL